MGAVKYEFLGNLCNQLTYSGLLLDDHPTIGWICRWQWCFITCFSTAIFPAFATWPSARQRLIGIPVPENFDNPFAARNVKDFWNRWHITLSAWMRDVVFSPLSKFLVAHIRRPTARADQLSR